MQLAVDAFRVDVSDRLALSQEVRLTPAEVQVLLWEGLLEARNFPVFRFFVNRPEPGALERAGGVSRGESLRAVHGG